MGLECEQSVSRANVLSRLAEASVERFDEAPATNTFCVPLRSHLIAGDIHFARAGDWATSRSEM